MSESTIPTGIDVSEFAFGRTATLLNSGSDTQAWRLSTEILTPSRFQFYQVKNGKRELILESRHQFRPHKTRASQGTVLFSTPIIFNPGERIELIAVFERDPDLEIFPVKLAPESAFVLEQRRLSALHGTYLGFVIVFLVFFVTFSLLLKSRPASVYAVYFLGLSILAFHSYGYTERLFLGWTSALYFPMFRLLQSFIMLSYLAFAISFLRARDQYPRLHKITLYYVGVTGILVIIEAAVYFEFFSLIVNAMALGFLGLGCFTAYIAVRDKLNGAIFLAAGFAVLLINGVFNYIASNRAFAVHNNTVDAITLFLQVLDAGIFACAIVSQTRGLSIERDVALEEKLAATQEKLTISEQLRDAKDERDKAARLAERHRSNLAMTSHDLRQPIASLKLALQDAGNLPSIAQDKLKTGLEYLDSVLEDVLVETNPDAEKSDNFTEDNHSGSLETVSLQVILDNLQRMFSAEALEKSLRLQIDQTDLVVHVQIVSLIRVLSNLVANALKYTDAGGITVSVLQEGAFTNIAVSDTGPGIDADTLQRIMRPYQRNNDDTIGEGLGLSIVSKLVREQGWTLETSSAPGAGSTFRITNIPLRLE
ncbi:MAG: sensor histidine kinase [Sphingorhabdus sp.]